VTIKAVKENEDDQFAPLEVYVGFQRKLGSGVVFGKFVNDLMKEKLNAFEAASEGQ